MDTVTDFTNCSAASPTRRVRLVEAPLAAVLIAVCVLRPSVLTAQSNGVVPGAVRAYSTLSSIGIEWDLSGDDDHDASATVEYRVAGTSAWRPALPLVRTRSG